MKKIYFLIMLSLTGLSGILAQIPTNGLLAWYQFDGNATDSSGNNNHGVVAGPTPTIDRFSRSNHALLFNGNGNYVSVANNVWSNSLTLSAWIYANDFGSINPQNSGKIIFFKAPNTGYNEDYNLNVGYDINGYPRVSFVFGQSSTDLLSLNSNTVLQSHHWYLITATRENGVAKIYINGNLDNTANYTFTPVNQNYNLTLGMSNVASQSFSGILDEMRIYNRALSIQEINNIYNEQINKALIAWYPCDGNVLDTSGNNFNGTNYGAVNTSDRFNNPGKALMFNGSGNYINVPHDIWSNSLTLSAWINVNDFGSTNPQNSGKIIFFKALNTGYNEDYNLNVGYDINGFPRVSFVFGQSSSEFFSLNSKSALQTNQWYLITATRENGVAKIYINATLDTTENYNFIPINQGYNLQLGMSNAAMQSFSGKLDELKIYNYALTISQISGLYTAINENADLGETLKIFPNPASTILNISLSDQIFQQNTMISIYDIQGQLLMQQNITDLQSNIDIHSFATGIYIVKVSNEKEILQTKFVKE